MEGGSVLGQGLLPSQESPGTVVSAPGCRERDNKGVRRSRGRWREVEGGGAVTKTCRDDPQTAAGTTTEV